VPRRCKAAHVLADLRKYGGGRQSVDAGYSAKQTDQGSKAGATRLHLRIHVGDRRFDLPVDLDDRLVQGVVLAQVELEQEPMMIRQPTMQRVVQLLGRGLDPPVGQSSQLRWIPDASDHCLDHPAA